MTDAETRFQERQVKAIRETIKDKNPKRLREFGIDMDRLKLIQEKAHRHEQQTNGIQD